jgi:hypothetical protein
MDKRNFFKASSVLGALSLSSISALSTAADGVKNQNRERGPSLLTITGLINKANRGALDPALDQMMFKQKLKFDKAFAFDFSALHSLPKVIIKPTLEYDNKVHALSGPLLFDVLKHVGAKLSDQSKIVLRAIDGYAVIINLEQLKKYRFILAMHIDQQPLALGGLGPVWAVYDADRIDEFASKPVNERFALCPWGVYHIDVL